MNNTEEKFNDESRRRFHAAARTKGNFEFAGNAAVVLFTGILFLIIEFRDFSLILNILICVFAGASAMFVVKTFLIFPLAAYNAPENEFPALRQLFEKKMSCSAFINKTEGNITYLVDDRRKHLAVTGFYRVGDVGVIWIFGKSWFLDEIDEYLENVNFEEF